MTRLQRYCQRCIRNATRGKNKLCTACKEKGWRWCSFGKHVVTVDVMKTRSACRACSNAKDRQYRSVPPPPGYIPLAEYAAMTHYTRHHIANRCQAGKLRAWQRKKSGPWYVEVSR